MAEATLLGFSGLVLIAVIALLLFVEEVGVPLVVAPGDLLLTIGGVAIAAGRVDPLLFSGVAFAAIVAGAMCGRELFALLGWERLMRVARRVRAEKPLGHAARLLQRNGWRGVFLARLIPGLRVHTTQIAGVSGLPRHTFVLGVAPASAVYVIAFVGLGAALGHPALALLRSGEHRFFTTVAFLGGALVILLLLRRRLVQLAEQLELNDWRGAFLVRPTGGGLALIPVGIGIDYAGHTLATLLGLPLFLDSAGTVLVALLAGPWVGAAAGLAANLLSAGTIDPIAAGYAIVSLAIGLAAGLGARAARRPLRGGLVLWGLCFLVASVASTPINLLLHDGRSGVPLADGIYAALLGLGVPRVAAAYLGEASVDLPDKLIAVVVAMLLAAALAPRPVAFRAAPHPHPPPPGRREID
ncbi:MAG TPA: VTT domain-containing protein [Candidatus Dormibacteraeota bacterium]|nr:VTT domain-containing protein [Candidatus Dormibacteraeota bacterium]